MKNKKYILGGLLLLGIGFAAVSTTLYINGTDFTLQTSRSNIRLKNADIIKSQAKTLREAHTNVSPRSYTSDEKRDRQNSYWR